MDAAEQFEKDYEQGRRFGWIEAADAVYEMAQKLPAEQRRLVMDAIWYPLKDRQHSQS